MAGIRHILFHASQVLWTLFSYVTATSLLPSPTLTLTAHNHHSPPPPPFTRCLLLLLRPSLSGTATMEQVDKQELESTFRKLRAKLENKVSSACPVTLCSSAIVLIVVVDAHHYHHHHHHSTCSIIAINRFALIVAQRTQPGLVFPMESSFASIARLFIGLLVYTLVLCGMLHCRERHSLMRAQPIDHELIVPMYRSTVLDKWLPAQLENMKEGGNGRGIDNTTTTHTQRDTQRERESERQTERDRETQRERERSID
jgi:hypothetical protein